MLILKFSLSAVLSREVLGLVVFRMSIFEEFMVLPLRIEIFFLGFLDLDSDISFSLLIETFLGFSRLPKLILWIDFAKLVFLENFELWWIL